MDLRKRRHPIIDCMSCVLAIGFILMCVPGIDSSRVRANTIGINNDTINVFINKLFHGYDETLPPSLYTGNRTTVRVGIFVHAISEVNERSMDYSVNMFLRQYWNDARLNYEQEYSKPLTLNAMKNKIWVPDLYFINEKQGHFHLITTPNLLLRLKPNGDITFSQKLTVKLSCPMNLEKFPLDHQSCVIKMESYGYTTNELLFEWITSNDHKTNVQFSDDLELPEFEKPTRVTGNCTIEYLTGSYTCLIVAFKLKRKFGFYLIQTYIPSLLIVVLSWVSFWIDVQAVPARITLGLLTVLSTTTQSSGARGSLPRVSYIKAIDVWMSACLVFVVGALIEFAIANIIARRKTMQHKQTSTAHQTNPRDVQLSRNGQTETIFKNEESQNEKVCPSSCNENTDNSQVYSSAEKGPTAAVNPLLTRRLFKRLDSYGTSKPLVRKTRSDRPQLDIQSEIEKTDVISRTIFPLAFLVFNVGYWLYYAVILP